MRLTCQSWQPLRPSSRRSLQRPTLYPKRPALYPNQRLGLARLPAMTVPPSERDEIKQRLANFKAHQLRMQAEREDYYLQTMTRTRAVLDKVRTPKWK